MVQLSDLDLVAKFQTGDQASFEELISRYSAKAYSLAYRLTRSHQDAEEVLQDVFQTVYRKINKFEGRSQFSSWLYRITVNCSFMRLRKTRRDERVISIEDISPATKAEWQCQKSEKLGGDVSTYRHALKDAFEEALKVLPQDYRPVFILRDVDGLSNREVGNILGLTIPAVKSRLHRARLMLRRKLQPYYEELEQGERKVA